MKRFSVSPGSKARRITAAEEDELSPRIDDNYDIEDIDIDNDGFSDKLDDVVDTVEDIQNTVDSEDVEEDISIDLENNIANHYIAECEKCKGVFISATIRSDQNVNSVTGECPLCGEETEQFLKWYITSVSDEDTVEV